MNPDQPQEKSLAELKDELKRLQVKLRNSDDKDIKEALQLKIDDLQEKVDSMAESLPDAPAVEEEEPEEDLGPIVPPSPEELERSEQFIREARVATMRGQAAEAAELLKQAAEAAPTSINVLEMQGDELAKQNRHKEARAAYKKALRIDPKHIAIERKYAEAVLKSSDNLTIDDQMRMNLSESPFINSGDQIASVKAATLLSVFIPGAGQFVTGETKKGLGIFFGWLFCMFFLILMNDDIKVLLSMAGVGTRTEGVSQFNAFVLVPMSIAFILHISSIIMIAVKVSESEKTQPKKTHPKPPVDLPFE